MSKFNTIGGLRLKHSGRVSSGDLANKITTVLNSLVGEFELESFGGVNLYLQVYDKAGQRLGLITKDGNMSTGINITGLQEDFSWKKAGLALHPVNEIQDALKESEQERVKKQEELNATYRKEANARRIEEEALRHGLNKVRGMICTEFKAKQFSDVGSSVGRIITTKGMTKYIKESDIPECGYVYRASLRDPNTGKISEVRIYDGNFNLIATIMT